jgi:malonate transporter and related proteins
LKTPSPCPSFIIAPVLFVFSITLPFFALVLLGFVATRCRLLPLTAIPGLNAYVLYFALPCMLFRFGANTPISQLLDSAVFMVYAPCALIMVGFTIAVTLSNRTNWNNASLGALVAAFPNTGFMGLPLLIALLGTQATGPAIITIVIDMLITTSLCVALSRLDVAGEHGAWFAFKKAILGMLSNPMPWGIVLGTAAAAFDYELLGPAAKTVELLGTSASPVALFTIGAVLARSSLQSIEVAQANKDFYRRTTMPMSQGGQEPSFNTTRITKDMSEHIERKLITPQSIWLSALSVALFKLFLHPVLVVLAGAIAIQNGVPLTPFALTVIVLVAALPSASNVSLLAEKFGADNGRIARIILISTALAFLTFSGVATLLLER